jgi:hypothetical protein
VFTLPGILPDNFSFAAQAIVLDNGAPGAPPVAVSNMINVKVGTCSPAGPCNNRLENGPFTITNTTGTARTIATINFNVPAGGLANPRMISVPSGVVVRTVNAAVGNNIVITFASNTPVQNNGSASFRVCSDNPGISINTVNWQ